MSEETSLTWLGRIQRGCDEVAWSQLSELYGPFIRRILASRGLKNSDCDDAVQSVMIVLLRRLPEFD